MDLLRPHRRLHVPEARQVRDGRRLLEHQVKRGENRQRRSCIPAVNLCLNCPAQHQTRFAAVRDRVLVRPLRAGDAAVRGVRDDRPAAARAL